MVENGLADAHRLRGDLDEFVFLDVFEAFFEGHDDLGNDARLVVGTRGTDIGELLGLANVDDEVVVVNVFADDLTHVDVLTGIDEELASILQLVDGVGIGIARLEGYHGTVDATLDVALEGLILLEAMGHDGLALRSSEHIGTQSDDAT